MEIKTCRECRRLFNYLSGDNLCPECKKKLEKKFQEVKEYIRDHENVVINQISKDCKVSISQIKIWIREDRLHATDEESVCCHCENCGMSIPFGNFCNICKYQLINKIENAFEVDKLQKDTKPKKDSPKMRFIHH
ncbi:flagellar protein [bacterium D16-51]|nr:flagellar protein [bacterium D16-59]RKI56170.1 flagellar protein [bacterium D16-51]